MPKQTFQIEDNNARGAYIKYLKFEMLSYQGEEQLCTLTWLGVFGWGEFNPLPEEEDEVEPHTDKDKAPQEDPDPIKKGVEIVVGAIKNIWPSKTAEETLTEEKEDEFIDDSFHDCWLQSALLW